MRKLFGVFRKFRACIRVSRVSDLGRGKKSRRGRKEEVGVLLSVTDGFKLATVIMGHIIETVSLYVG